MLTFNGYLHFILSFQASYLVAEIKEFHMTCPHQYFRQIFLEIVQFQSYIYLGNLFFEIKWWFQGHSFHRNIECLFWFMCCTSSHWRTWTWFSRWQWNGITKINNKLVETSFGCVLKIRDPPKKISPSWQNQKVERLVTAFFLRQWLWICLDMYMCFNIYVYLPCEKKDCSCENATNVMLQRNNQNSKLHQIRNDPFRWHESIPKRNWKENKDQNIGFSVTPACHIARTTEKKRKKSAASPWSWFDFIDHRKNIHLLHQPSTHFKSSQGSPQLHLLQKRHPFASHHFPSTRVFKALCCSSWARSHSSTRPEKDEGRSLYMT